MTREELIAKGYNPDEVGKAVYCQTCTRVKKPIGRDSWDIALCDHECPGYREEPHVGSLWPGETREEFGY